MKLLGHSDGGRLVGVAFSKGLKFIMPILVLPRLISLVCFFGS